MTTSIFSKGFPRSIEFLEQFPFGYSVRTGPVAIGNALTQPSKTSLKEPQINFTFFAVSYAVLCCWCLLYFSFYLFAIVATAATSPTSGLLTALSVQLTIFFSSALVCA